jgi:hypothetical protein
MAASTSSWPLAIPCSDSRFSEDPVLYFSKTCTSLRGLPSAVVPVASLTFFIEIMSAVGSNRRVGNGRAAEHLANLSTRSSPTFEHRGRELANDSRCPFEAGVAAAQRVEGLEAGQHEQNVQ